MHYTHHIFTGDSIIGGISSNFRNYVDYLNSLIKTQKLVTDLSVDKLFVGHSNSFYTKDIAFDAPKKVKAYVDRRIRKDKELEMLADYLTKEIGAFTVKDVY